MDTDFLCVRLLLKNCFSVFNFNCLNFSMMMGVVGPPGRYLMYVESSFMIKGQTRSLNRKLNSRFCMINEKNFKLNLRIHIC